MQHSTPTQEKSNQLGIDIQRNQSYQQANTTEKAGNSIEMEELAAFKKNQ
jgi:hypothetical protein